MPFLTGKPKASEEPWELQFLLLTRPGRHVIGSIATEGIMARSELFADRLAAERKRLEEEAAALPHGPKKEELLRKIRQLETASHINDWASSPGLQPPN